MLTDLSKLGKPGTHFVHDFFLPGSQLTFQQSAAKQVAALANVAQVTSGLTLLAEHQEGVVPKIVAKLKTGGQTFRIQRNIPRPTAAQFQAMQACFAKLRGQNSGAQRRRRRRRRLASGGGGGGGGGGFGGGADRGAFAKCLPARLRRLRTQFTTPQQTLQQVLDPPQTNIKTTAYTIGGVDQTQPTMGVVTTAQVTKGRFLAPSGGKEALVSTTYAAKHSLKVGSTLDLNGTSFTVVGLVNPPLGGQSADVYLPLKQLQTLANEAGLANVVLVRATIELEGRRGAGGDQARAAAARRSRARSRSPTRSAARSSTRRTSRTTSASCSRSSPPRPRSCSPRCSRSRRSASACASSAR